MTIFSSLFGEEATNYKLIEQEKEDNNNIIQLTSQIEESMSVSDTIIDYAENQNIDLIVVGSIGRQASKSCCLEVLLPR